MSRSVIRQLIVKDLQLNRIQIFFTMIGGALALALTQWGGEVPFVVGTVWFFISLILIAHMLPIAGIVNERKKQNLAFIMSLPISPNQYTTAKLLATLAIFLAPWLTLVISSLVLIEVRGFLPKGAIPVTLILAMLPFVGFCIITGASLVGETEGWGIGANVVCSSSYGLTWYFMTRIPGLMVNMKANAPVWNATAIKILGAEAGSIVLILLITFFLQSRKRDFI